MLTSILSHLPEDFPWKNRISHFTTVESTNTLAKNLGAQGAPHGTVLIADAQTGGRGRMGRSFHSPAGSGIYLSLILRPECHASQLMHLTCAVAVAMCDAVHQACGIHPGIKWINDLVYDSRKLGGILTELSLRSDGTVEYAVIGIGINCSQRAEDFPEDIRSIATSLFIATKKDVCRSKIAACMIEALKKMSNNLFTAKVDIMDRYRQNCITLGKDVSIHRDGNVCYGVASDMDENGTLIVDFADGHRETVGAGEVSVRGLYGYI